MAIGTEALNTATTQYNTAIGYRAGYQSASSTSSDYGSYVGTQAGYQNTGDNVSAMGRNSAFQNTGSNVSTMGYASAYQNTGANVSTMGYASAYQNTGSSVSAMGYYSAYQNSGGNVSAMGHNSARENTGDNVSAIGMYSAYQNSGTSISAMGVNSAYQNTGGYVSAMGMYSAYQNAGGNGTFVGYEAGYTNTGANVVALGYQAGKGNNTASQFIVKQGNVNAVPLMQGDFSTGSIGIGTTSPTVRLHVAGTIRMADGGEDCDGNRAGAMKFNGGVFYVCDGSSGWETLAEAAAGTAADRIVSGTTSVVASEDRSVTISTAGSARMTIGENGNVGIGTGLPQNGSLLHLVGNNATFSASSNADDLIAARTGSAVGLSLLTDDARTSSIYFGSPSDQNGGAISWNHDSDIFTLGANNSGADVVITAGNGSEVIRVLDTGNVGIGTASPSNTLSVKGNADVSGTIQLSGAGNEACGPGTRGTLRIDPATNMLQICRR